MGMEALNEVYIIRDIEEVLGEVNPPEWTCLVRQSAYSSPISASGFSAPIGPRKNRVKAWRRIAFYRGELFVNGCWPIS